MQGEQTMEDQMDLREDLWPDFVNEYVSKHAPVQVAGAGIATRFEDDRIVVVFTSYDEKVYHFILNRGRAEMVASMLEDVLEE